MIKVINFKYEPPEGALVINTTSRSDNWSKGLSPFFLGPCEAYDGHSAKNVENLWQYSKVYGHLGHLDENSNPNETYFKWAQDGWNKITAERYPAGRGAKPAYCYWAGEKLDYIAARKKIYIPAYSKAVQQSFAFQKLKRIYDEKNKETILYLKDFDAHSLTPGTFDYCDLWNNDQIKVGHAYVIAMLLEGIIE
jgi:hypothetical protein